MVNVSEALEIDRILEHSGFEDSAQRSIITAYGLDSSDNILILGESDIASIAKRFSDRTVAAGKIRFSLLRTNILNSNIHWDQDFRSISWTPSLIGISNAAKFRTEIEAPMQRVRIRKHSIEESPSLSKAADPANMKRHKDWITRYRALKNYLLTILGQDGVPLRYVIRESAALEYTIESQPDYDFEQLFINCVPLTFLNYKTDARKVYQLIHGFVQGETADTWIKPKERKKCG